MNGFITLLKWQKEIKVSDMLAQKEYYKIVVKDNETATVYKIDYDEYNDFQNDFEYVYHTKSGEKYPLEKYYSVGIDMLVVDEEHLYELLDDLREQDFCDAIEFSFIDDFFSGNYKQYSKAF